ncbi:MAG: hypothetical protein PF636_01500 [Actinomycetota bacterium]|jgi:hypothetical protein|nr:hypothetical protein [Actinomycetota bacterium]
MQFPPLPVRDLEGHDYVIPHELPGGPHVILLAFQQWHQIIVNAWMPHLEAFADRHPGTEVWEVPSISKGYRLFRAGIDGGMRAGIPDVDVRKHTLTAYTDVGKLAAALELDSLETVHVLLVDCTGEVLSHAEGEPNEQALADLESAIRDACS